MLPQQEGESDCVQRVKVLFRELVQEFAPNRVYPEGEFEDPMLACPLRNCDKKFATLDGFLSHFATLSHDIWMSLRKIEKNPVWTSFNFLPRRSVIQFSSSFSFFQGDIAKLKSDFLAEEKMVGKADYYTMLQVKFKGKLRYMVVWATTGSLAREPAVLALLSLGGQGSAEISGKRKRPASLKVEGAASDEEGSTNRKKKQKQKDAEADFEDDPSAHQSEEELESDEEGLEASKPAPKRRSTYNRKQGSRKQFSVDNPPVSQFSWPPCSETPSFPLWRPSQPAASEMRTREVAKKMYPEAPILLSFPDFKGRESVTPAPIPLFGTFSRKQNTHLFF